MQANFGARSSLALVNKLMFGYAARSQQQIIINLSYFILSLFTMLFAARDFAFPFVPLSQ